MSILMRLASFFVQALKVLCFFSVQRQLSSQVLHNNLPQTSFDNQNFPLIQKVFLFWYTAILQALSSN